MAKRIMDSAHRGVVGVLVFVLVVVLAACTESSKDAPMASTAPNVTTITTARVYEYAVGDAGPGGGTVFYVADQPFACGFELSESCYYLEVAPSGWFDGGKDPAASASVVPYEYSPLTENYQGTEPVGLGMHNTRNSVLAAKSASPGSASALATEYKGGGLTDWYLPSLAESVLLQKNQVVSSALLEDWYWTSSEYDSYGNHSWSVHMFNPGSQMNTPEGFVRPKPLEKIGRAYVRPVRAF